MTSEHFRAGHHDAEAPAFDADGTAIPVVDFDYAAVDGGHDTVQAVDIRAIRSESWHELMDAVAGRETDPVVIFHRFMYAMFIIGNPLAPKSYRSLAHYLRLPLSTVHYQVERLKAEFAMLAGSNRTEVEQ